MNRNEALLVLTTAAVGGLRWPLAWVVLGLGACAVAPKSVAGCLAVPARAGYVLLVQADANAPTVDKFGGVRGK